MAVNLRELLDKRVVLQAEPDAKSADSLIKTALGNIKAAEDNLKMGHADWALAIAYNAMLTAGRALMAAKGYRPSSDSHHVAVVQFCAALLPADASELVSAFNRYRVRRHDVVYGEPQSVGDDEAKRAIANATKFVEKIKIIVH